MTFSLVACDLEQGQWGVTVASKFPSVGAVVPWAGGGTGAVATQSYANVTYGPRGLELLAAGRTAVSSRSGSWAWSTRRATAPPTPAATA